MRFSRYVWYASVSSEVFSTSFFPLVTSANGDGEIRTLDPLLARQVLSQLSYTPIKFGNHLLSHIVSNVVPSAA